jgi:hypothetical protein
MRLMAKETHIKTDKNPLSAGVLGSYHKRPLSFSFVAASLRPVYCTSFAQGERHPQTHHVIRYDLLNLMVKLNRLSVRLAEEKIQILVKLDVRYASFCLCPTQLQNNNW